MHPDHAVALPDRVLVRSVPGVGKDESGVWPTSPTRPSPHVAPRASADRHDVGGVLNHDACNGESNGRSARTESADAAQRHRIATFERLPRRIRRRDRHLKIHHSRSGCHAARDAWIKPPPGILFPLLYKLLPSFPPLPPSPLPGRQSKNGTRRGPRFRVASEGFEPPKSKTADLQSDPFGRLGNSPGASAPCIHRPDALNKDTRSSRIGDQPQPAAAASRTRRRRGDTRPRRPARSCTTGSPRASPTPCSAPCSPGRGSCADASTASSMFCGSSCHRPPSTCQLRQVCGISCIGPTARSASASPSIAPPSLSGTAPTPSPSSATPKIGGVVLPSAADRRPAVPTVVALDVADRRRACSRRARSRHRLGLRDRRAGIGGERARRDAGLGGRRGHPGRIRQVLDRPSRPDARRRVGGEAGGAQLGGGRRRGCRAQRARAATRSRSRARRRRGRRRR